MKYLLFVVLLVSCRHLNNSNYNLNYLNKQHFFNVIKKKQIKYDKINILSSVNITDKYNKSINFKALINFNKNKITNISIYKFGFNILNIFIDKNNNIQIKKNKLLSITKYNFEIIKNIHIYYNLINRILLANFIDEINYDYFTYENTNEFYFLKNNKNNFLVKFCVFDKEFNLITVNLSLYNLIKNDIKVNVRYNYIKKIDIPYKIDLNIMQDKFLVEIVNKML